MKWSSTDHRQDSNNYQKKREQARYFEYETQKKILQLKNLSPQEYEKQLRALADKYEI